ncbi:hypothetical protein [Listeria newyorkensis]|uniref:hypothetical protein n=1 Tax=Listeria newyorkensis TaxID=1497681 RepID=UPI00051D2525|nr:hypothetical protein [Listeria newyorkensis]KGL43589.1 hypothetical protein EP58_07565 [Listeria newyorkensis]SQC56815.1 Uncharacterised protein [Listeria newyorkensis]
MTIHSIEIAEEESEAILERRRKAIALQTTCEYFPGDILALHYTFSDIFFTHTTVIVTDVEVLERVGYVILSIEKHCCDYCREELSAYLTVVSGRDHYHKSCLENLIQKRIVRKKEPTLHVKVCSCRRRFIAKSGTTYGKAYCKDCAFEWEMDDYYVGSPDELRDRHNS